MTAALLRAKAEVVLGVLLVSRHRAVRLATGLSVLLLALALAGPDDPVPRGSMSLLVVAGSLAVIAGSRLVAPGPAVAALRAAAGPWWLAPSGRLIGALLVVGAVVWGGAVVVVVPGAGWGAAVRAGTAAWLCAGALGALTMAAAPLTGASAAGALGLLAAWLGGIPPSGVGELLGSWPLVARPLVLCWNVLPLAWRAARWEVAGGADAALLLGWIAAGTGLTAWVVATVHRGERPVAGHAP